jgi:hypothetical protein
MLRDGRQEGDHDRKIGIQRSNEPGPWDRTEGRGYPSRARLLRPKVNCPAHRRPRGPCEAGVCHARIVVGALTNDVGVHANRWAESWGLYSRNHIYVKGVLRINERSSGNAHVTYHHALVVFPPHR